MAECKIDSYFKLKENNTTVRQEMLAGLTTFLAMAYILAVNPNILSAAGMPRGGVMVATALSAAIGTFLMAFCANYPFALAPGMGLNAFFAYTVVLGMGSSWQFALLAVFVEGLIFLALSLTPVREAIFNSIPLPLKAAVSVGIGLFIAFIGLQGGKVIVDNPATLLGLQGFSKAPQFDLICAILTLIGVLVTAYLLVKEIRGAILLGILITWILGIICELTGLYVVDVEHGQFSMIPKLSLAAINETFTGTGEIFGALFKPASWTLKGSEATGFSLVKSFNFVVIMFAFMFVDIFDTLGTLIGVASKADMLDKDGKLKNIRGALLSDSIATSLGAIFGTSTVTTFVESAAGVAAGGRTGLTAITAGILFVLSIILAPIFLAIPAFATAPALIIVGFYMVCGISKIDFNEYRDSIPAYLCILTMPFAYSISDGICFGVISWTIINLFTGRASKINPLMYVLTILFLAKYAAL